VFVDYAGEDPVSMLPHVPVNAGEWRYALVFLDTRTWAANTLAGVGVHHDETPVPPNCPSYGIPSAYIVLRYGATNVSEANIYDARFPFWPEAKRTVLGTPTELTIADETITITGSYHTIACRYALYMDALDTIIGGVNGQLLYLQNADGDWPITIRNAVGNIYTPDGNNFTLDVDYEVAALIYNADAAVWMLIGGAGGGGGGAGTFLGLTDTPASYAFQGGRVPRVTIAEDGLEFYSLPEPFDTDAIHVNVDSEILGIPDKPVPSTYDIVVIEDSEDGWEKKQVAIGNLPGGGASTFLDLTDTPADYTDDAGKVVAVNAGETALEFISRPVFQALWYFQDDLTVVASPLRIYNASGVNRTISKVFIAVNTAPTGAAIIVDVHKNGVTIFTVQGNRPQIAATEFTGQSTDIDVSAWDAGQYLTAEIDQIGSTIAGKDLVVHVVYS
jgi:hypothetical protein